MNIFNELQSRSESKCELCNSPNQLDIYEIPPNSNKSAEQSIYICAVCKDQIEQITPLNPYHWHCLSSCMWSEISAIQVMAWRMLNQLKNESWAQDLFDQIYLDDEVLAWAKSIIIENNNEDILKHLDANGTILQAGDSVTLIKDLNVKGANFTAKRGTAVRNIILVTDNENYIEGRVNGQQIVILTEFVKRSS